MVTKATSFWVPGLIMPSSLPLPGLYLDGVGDFGSIPDNDALDLVDGFDIRISAMMNDWTPSYTALVAKSGVSKQSYGVGINTTGAIQALFSSTGAGFSGLGTFGPNVGGVTGEDKKPYTFRTVFRCNNGAAGKDVKVYRRPFHFDRVMEDLLDDTVAGGKWLLSGTDTAAGTLPSLFVGTGNLFAGATYDGTWPANGVIFGIVIKTLAGDLVESVDFAHQDSSTMTDDQQNPWTWAGNAFIQPNMMEGFLLADGSPFDPTVYPDLDELYQHGAVHGTDGTTGWPLTPDYMNGNKFIRGGFKVGVTGGAASHLFTFNNNTTTGGAGTRVTTIDSSSANVNLENQPPFVDAAVWVKT